MGSGQMGTARGEEVAEAAGGGEAGGGVERERLAELRVLLCTRAHELRSSVSVLLGHPEPNVLVRALVQVQYFTSRIDPGSVHKD